MADFAQTLMTTLAVGSLYALIALGYTMVYGTLKFINFAHSDIVVLGAWLELHVGNVDAAVGWHQPEEPRRRHSADLGRRHDSRCCDDLLRLRRLHDRAVAYRPLRKAPRLNVLITAIGVSLLLQNLGQLDVTIQDLPLIGHYLNAFLQMIPGIRAICDHALRVRRDPAEDAGPAAALGSAHDLAAERGRQSRRRRRRSSTR